MGYGPTVFGHRGSPRQEVENTMASFAAAVAAGADGIECDLRRSADGIVVIHHDPDYRDGRAVHETVAGDRPDGVPLLAEVIAEYCGRVQVNLEIKNLPTETAFDPEAAIVGLVAAEVRAAESRGAEIEGVSISSFHPPTLDRVRRDLPGVPTGVLTFVVPTAADAITIAVAGGHEAIHPHVSQVDADLVSSAHRHGLVVNVWTVNDDDIVARMVDVGVDGIITDVPGEVRRLVDAAG